MVGFCLFVWGFSVGYFGVFLRGKCFYWQISVEILDENEVTHFATNLAKLREDYTTKSKNKTKNPKQFFSQVYKEKASDKSHNLQERKFQLSITIGKNFTQVSIKSCPESWQHLHPLR